MTLQRLQLPVPPSQNPANQVGGVKGGEGVEITPEGQINFVGRVDIPSGSIMYFYDGVAPVGWTRLTEAKYDQAAIQLVTSGGSASGGLRNFTDVLADNQVKTSQIMWTSLQTTNTALSESTMPSHNHTFFLIQGRNQPVLGGGASTRADAPVSKSTTSVGGSAAHSHSLAGTTATGTFTFNLGVSYADFIVARRN